MRRHQASIDDILGTGLEKPEHPIDSSNDVKDPLSSRQIDIMLEAKHFMGLSWEQAGSLFGASPAHNVHKWRNGYPVSQYVHGRILAWEELCFESFLRVAPLVVLAKSYPVYAGYVLQSLSYDMEQDVKKLVDNFWTSLEKSGDAVRLDARSI